MLPIKNFYGKIGEKTIYDFSRTLDYNINTPEERIEFVKNLLYNPDGTKTKFFEEIFTQKFDLKSEMEEVEIEEPIDSEEAEKSEEETNTSKLSFTGQNVSHIKLILSKDDGLYSETNIAKELEKITNYILFSLDKEERTEYKIYKDEELFKKILKEQSVDGESSSDTDNIIHFLMKQNQNFKLEKKQKIKNDDIESIQELKEYQNLLDSISFKLRRIALLEKLYSKTKQFTYKEELTQEDIEKLGQYNLTIDDLTKELYKSEQKNKSTLQKHSALIKEDMLYIKDCKKGTIYFKQPLSDSTEVDYDMIDFTNKKHIEALLKIPPKGEDLQNDMVCIQYDLENLINSCNFNEKDLKILHMFRNGFTQEIIGKKIGVKQQTIDNYIDKIVNKIIDTYKAQYENWYYLEVEKGTYKTCSRCGEVKLATERNFAKRGNNGWVSHCRECERKRKLKK